MDISDCQTSEMKCQQAIEARGLELRTGLSYILDFHSITATIKVDKISGEKEEMAEN